MPHAARLTDPVEHTHAMTGLLTGVLAGAVIGALTVATGGGALVVAAAVVGGAAAGGGVGQVLGSLSISGGSVTGRIVTGSPNVIINGLPAARCHQDAGDPGLCSGMPPLSWPPHGTVLIAQGSSTVLINNQPAARVGDSLQCGARISAGSPDVIIGGAQVTTLEIEPEIPDWLNMTLLAAGIGSAVVLAGPVVALVGLAGSLGLGSLAEEAGGELFGEGSDGQKVMSLVGSMVGGGFLARASAMKFRVPRVNFMGIQFGPRVVRPAYDLGNMVGGRTGAFIRNGVRGIPRTQPEAHAQRAAAQMRSTMSKSQQNKHKMTSTAIDRSKPDADPVIETSGAPRPTPEEVHPKLRPSYPKKSLEDWHIENCAEFKAVNRALHRGSRLEDLDVATVRTMTGKAVPRCANCMQTIQGARVSTDPVSAGTAAGVGTVEGASGAPQASDQ